ncbi:hypothetical protein D9613_000021 [Agrocybe pediades]|uniref:PHD-type domain-containing protein n=1 Tax=Agrocybe pediades TaxID=84607 RepID=A0A8H4R310_9AGAR|nr:hypothetical protein D9613_000021 [Agrocybe pediades]
MLADCSQTYIRLASGSHLARTLLPDAEFEIGTRRWAAFGVNFTARTTLFEDTSPITMVLGFLRHVYQYFQPPEVIGRPEQNSLPTLRPSKPKTKPDYMEESVPIYGIDGQTIEGYRRIPPRVHVILPSAVRADDRGQLNPTPIPHISAAPPSISAPPSLHAKTVSKHYTDVVLAWDGWPNDAVEEDYTFSEFEETGNLRIHWANRGHSPRGGDADASCWEEGKRQKRTCLGAILCNDSTCDIVIRPQTSVKQIESQLSSLCPAAENENNTSHSRSLTLYHVTCDVVATTYRWEEGVHFSNSGVHDHPRPPPLHALPWQKKQFKDIVTSNPKAKALSLMVGVPTLEGPGASVMDIGDVYKNRDRVDKERQEIVRSLDSGGDKFIFTFADFCRDHPEAIVYSVFGEVTVISVQTPFMRSNLIKDDALTGPVNGIVNDATHSYWKEKNALLMISSCYCPILFCWLPGLMSYTNGGTEQHFTHHFYALFTTMAQEANKRGIEVTDHIFAGMMDFSQAERNGFKAGFVSFWLSYPDDSRSEEELREAVQRLLKGCKEHWRAAITRIARITGVVPPDQHGDFTARAEQLPNLPNAASFRSACAELVKDYPKAKDWMSWWTREDNASLLFGSELAMDRDLSRSLRTMEGESLGTRFGLPSYPWVANSCWLDTSLELIFHAIEVTYPFSDFTSLFDSIHPDSLAYEFYNLIEQRYIMGTGKFSQDQMVKMNKNSRDIFRKSLLEGKVIQGSIKSTSSLVGWLSGLLLPSDQVESKVPEPTSFFITWLLDIHRCGGTTKSQGRHVQLVGPRKSMEFQLNAEACKIHKGSFAKWFTRRFGLEKPSFPAHQCWRVYDGECFCAGRRSDQNNIVCHIPGILPVEVVDYTSSTPDKDASNVWEFPSSVYPLGKGETGKDEGIVYDLIGLALLDPSSEHFIARYADEDRKTIYTYDGMKHGGKPVIEENASFETHVSGRRPNIPKGYRVYAAFYHLRGGIAAQKEFFEIRTKQISKKFSIEILGDIYQPVATLKSKELVQLPPIPRPVWRRAQAQEYVLPSAVNVYKATVPDHGDSEGEDEVSATGSSEEDEDEAENLLLQTHATSHPPSLVSEPDSLFDLHCVCGRNGDGNKLYDAEEEGEAIQCDDCRDWSHIACQRYGRAHSLKEDEPFICDFCDLGNGNLNLPIGQGSMKSLSKKKPGTKAEMERRTQHKRPLNERLRRGRGALARIGEYWYPVRLIHRLESGEWRVRWWRGCKVGVEGLNPGCVATVKEEDLVDSLWMDRTERRKIKLGRWTQSWNTKTAEDILEDPSLVSYTSEVDEALSSSKKTLEALFKNPGGVDSKLVPSKDWLESKKKDIKTTVVPYVGSLSLMDRARIANWFEVHISKDKKKRHLWLTLLPIAHAHTLFILYRLKHHPKYSGLGENELLGEAWSVQCSTDVDGVLFDFDVDLNCLAYLEEEMFENSARAGVAGNQQWGLDAGDHENGWNPYADIPAHWVHNNRKEGKDERERGPNYRTRERSPSLTVLEPKPRNKRVPRRIAAARSRIAAARKWIADARRCSQMARRWLADGLLAARSCSHLKAMLASRSHARMLASSHAEKWVP